MEAIGTTIPRTLDKETEAILAIQKYEPADGYYVAFSGGKDSIVMYDLVKRAGVKFDVHFNATTVDPPEVIEFIKTYYPEVDWIHPKKSMFQIIVKHMMLPTGNMRFCCHELKEIGGKDRTVVLGVRREESARRRNRVLYDESKRQKGKMFLNPIVDWSKDEVWEYIHKYNLPYPCLYDEGYNRVGCILCPLQNIKGRERDKERYPKYYNAYLLAIKRMLKIREEIGKPFKNGKTPEDVMNWWIYGGIKKKVSKEEKLKWFNELGGK